MEMSDGYTQLFPEGRRLGDFGEMRLIRLRVARLARAGVGTSHRARLGWDSCSWSESVDFLALLTKQPALSSTV